MKISIIKEFHDIEDFSNIFKVGDVVEFDEERALSILELGLGIKVVNTGSNALKRNKKSNSKE